MPILKREGRITMQNNNDYGVLARILDAQTMVLSTIENLQREVEKAVYAKQWVDFDGARKRLLDEQARLEALEEERRVFFGAENTDFYVWSAALPEDERERILASYRALKRQAARVRTFGETFSAYVREMQFVVNGFLDAAFPERKNGLYGRSGKTLAADMRSVVLDKQF